MRSRGEPRAKHRSRRDSLVLALQCSRLDFHRSTGAAQLTFEASLQRGDGASVLDYASGASALRVDGVAAGLALRLVRAPTLHAARLNGEHGEEEEEYSPPE